MADCWLKVLKLRKAQRLGGSGDAIVVLVQLLADCVDRARDVEARHSSLVDTILPVAAIDLVETSLLPFASLVLVVRVNEVPFLKHTRCAKPACCTRQQRQFTTYTRCLSTLGK